MKLATIVLGTMLAMPFTASAYSAFAIGLPANVAQQGVALGTAYNFKSRAEAETTAVQKCHEFNGVSNSVLSLCKVVAYFDNAWLVVSLDPRAGTPGYGWSIASTREEATRNAVQQCQATDNGMGAYCEVTIVDYDAGN